MSDILCITNRSLCQEDFLVRIEKIAAARPAGIVLREKDLSMQEYRFLAEKVKKICEKYDVNCILHTFSDVARELGINKIHLSMQNFLKMSEEEKTFFSLLGVSCHSMQDAVLAEKSGCSYITAGHIFDTDCKKGIPGRGLLFLENICKNVSVPVYAIGGINQENFAAVKNAGALGGCIMSSAMRCEDVTAYIRGWE